MIDRDYDHPDISDYKKYLRGNHWRQLRRVMLEAADYRCEALGCRSARRPHVHHRTYRNVPNNERPGDLVVLCEAHHTIVHQLKEQQGYDLNEATQIVLDGKRPLKQRQRRPKGKKRKRRLPKDLLGGKDPIVVMPRTAAVRPEFVAGAGRSSLDSLFAADREHYRAKKTERRDKKAQTEHARKVEAFWRAGQVHNQP